MRLVGVLFAAVMMLSAHVAVAASADARLERSLKMLGPVERLEQLCDYTAMTNIKKDGGQYRPDRAIAGAREEPHINGHTIEANGAAFRSRKKWYALTYRCTADEEHMKVLSFKYKVGDEIPESKWAAFNLFD